MVIMTDNFYWFSLTFSTVGENHAGNQQIGTMQPGFMPEMFMEDKMEVVKLHKDVPEALVGVVPNFCKDMENEMRDELMSLEWDRKVLMRGKVVNKHARYNLCFANFEQEPDYKYGRGRVYKFDDLPRLKELRKRVHEYMGSIGYDINIDDLIAEGNFYYSRDCYIGFHGDGERKLVFGVRISSEPMPIYFGAWQNREHIKGTMKEIMVESGNAYLMSEKACGFDWKCFRRNLITFRHAAGLKGNLKATFPDE